MNEMTLGRSKNSSDEQWKSVTFSEKLKLFRVHQFLFVAKGRTFNIEVQESTQGGCEAYASSTLDPNESIPSVHGKDLKDALQNIVNVLEGRSV